MGEISIRPGRAPDIQLSPEQRFQGIGTEACWLLGVSLAGALPERLTLLDDQEAARRMAERCGYQVVAGDDGFCLTARKDQADRLRQLSAYFDRHLEARLWQGLNAMGLPADYRRRMPRVAEARCLVRAGTDCFDRPLYLGAATLAAWDALREAAAADGVALQAISGFRDIDYQFNLIQRKLDRGDALETILEVSAAPGFSEHHGGFALDINTPGCEPLEADFAGTDAHAWLMAHAAAFGFVKSYPEDNPHGIAHEPWHWALASERDAALARARD